MSDRVRRFVQPAVPARSEPVEPALARCDECRGQVPWTDLREVGGDRICADCHSDFLYFRQRYGGGGLPA